MIPFTTRYKFQVTTLVEMQRQAPAPTRAQKNDWEQTFPMQPFDMDISQSDARTMDETEDKDTVSSEESPICTDRKVRASMKPGTQPLSGEGAVAVKKKRKSPAQPWKKPKGMPKRPLSAYNLFFKSEREKLLVGSVDSTKALTADDDVAPTAAKSHGTGGFAALTKRIAAQWNGLPLTERAPFEQQAAQEKAKYDEAMSRWRSEEKARKLPPEAKYAMDIEEESSDYSRDSIDMSNQSTSEHGRQFGNRASFADGSSDEFHIDNRRFTSSSIPRVDLLQTASGNFHSFSTSVPSWATQGSESLGDASEASPRRNYFPQNEPSSSQKNYVPFLKETQLASDFLGIQNQLEELRRARLSLDPPHQLGHFFLSGSEFQPYPPVQRSVSLPGSFHSGTIIDSHLSSGEELAPSSLDATYESACVRKRLSLPEYRNEAHLESNKEKQKSGTPNKVYEESLRSLSENLDEDSIKFLTSTRFE